jgi:ABC-type Na+ efflux pump permease subunit
VVRLYRENDHENLFVIMRLVPLPRHLSHDHDRQAPPAPFAMPVLAGLGSVTWWQFTISAALTATGTVAVARLATGSYRRAILRTGRRVQLREVLPGTAR